MITIVHCGQTVRDRQVGTVKRLWEVDIGISESAHKINVTLDNNEYTEQFRACETTAYFTASFLDDLFPTCSRQHFAVLRAA